MVSFDEGDSERRLKQEEYIKRRLKQQHSYDSGELRRRLKECLADIWYIPSLANNDITKYDLVRKSKYMDAVKTLEILIKQ